MKTNRNIFVTGASGFIGQHFCKTAIAQGHQVFALVRENSPGNKILKADGVNIVRGDLMSPSRLRVIFERLKEDGIHIDAVVHAAGLTKARTREEFMQVNYNGTHHLLDACIESGTLPERFIYLSSLAACGPEKYGNTIEASHQSPVTYYGESKLRSEMLIRAYSNIPHIIFRPTAVYGPGEKDLLTIFKLVSKGLNPVIGFHRQQLTFIYVSDLVSFMLAAMDSPQRDKTYFVTDGHTYDKFSLGKQIADLLHKKPLSIKIPSPLSKSIAFFSQVYASLSKKTSPFNLQKYKELVAGSWNCDAGTTFKDLNYVPNYDLQKGVDETLRWYTQHQWINVKQ